jgi:starch synthase
VLEALQELLEAGGQLVILGSGDARLDAAFGEAAARHPSQIARRTGMDEGLAHRIYAASDVVLVPSRFEPCGLTQLYGLRYGCLPVVARVGGLSDTIVDANDAALTLKAATGVQFHPVSVPMLQDAITRAVALFGDKVQWRAMQKRAMSLDLSWTSRAGAYAKLYREVLA